VIVLSSLEIISLDKDPRIAGFDPELSLVPILQEFFMFPPLSTVVLLDLLFQQKHVVGLLHVSSKYILKELCTLNPTLHYILAFLDVAEAPIAVSE